MVNSTIRNFFIWFLFICAPAWAAPDLTMSITPVATSGQTITASDENTRNNEIQSQYNSHTHTDITQVDNTLKLGDGNSGNKTIQANNTDSNLPFIRYDDTNDIWVASRDGTTVESILVMTGTDVSQSILPQSPSDLGILQFNADAGVDAWTSSTSIVEISLQEPNIDGGTIDSTVMGATSPPVVTNIDINDGTVDGITLAGASTHGAVFFNDGSNDVKQLAAGTSGQFLQSQGAGSDVQWANSGSAFSTSETLTNANSNLTIAADTVYSGVMALQANGTGDCEVQFRFNSDATSVYSWVRNNKSHATSPTDSVTGDNSDVAIDAHGVLGTDNWGYYTFTFTNPDQSDDTVWHLNGSGTYDANGTINTVDFSGRYNGGSAVTSVQVICNGGTNLFSSGYVAIRSIAQTQ